MQSARDEYIIKIAYRLIDFKVDELDLILSIKNIYPSNIDKIIELPVLVRREVLMAMKRMDLQNEKWLTWFYKLCLFTSLPRQYQDEKILKDSDHLSYHKNVKKFLQINDKAEEARAHLIRALEETCHLRDMGYYSQKLNELGYTSDINEKVILSKLSPLVIYYNLRSLFQRREGDFINPLPSNVHLPSNKKGVLSQKKIDLDKQAFLRKQKLAQPFFFTSYKYLPSESNPFLESLIDTSFLKALEKISVHESFIKTLDNLPGISTCTDWQKFKDKKYNYNARLYRMHFFRKADPAEILKITIAFLNKIIIKQVQANISRYLQSFHKKEAQLNDLAEQIEEARKLLKNAAKDDRLKKLRKLLKNSEAEIKNESDVLEMRNVIAASEERTLTPSLHVIKDSQKNLKIKDSLQSQIKSMEASAQINPGIEELNQTVRNLTLKANKLESQISLFNPATILAYLELDDHALNRELVFEFDDDGQVTGVTAEIVIALLKKMNYLHTSA